MPLERIAALDDPRLAVYRNLPQSKEAREQGRFVAEGMILVDRLLASEFPVESVLLEEKYFEQYQRWQEQTRLYVVPNGLVEEIIGFNFHRGVLACSERPAPATLESMCQQKQCLLVACAGVCDPQNLGGIIRNCAAFGADGVLLDSSCCDPYSRRVMRVSMGSNLKVPIRECEDLAGDLNALKQLGVTVVATTLDEATPVSTLAKEARSVLLFGNEGHGLEERYLQQADRRATIPMALETDSLNVAVTSGIMLYAWRFG